MKIYTISLISCLSLLSITAWSQSSPTPMVFTMDHFAINVRHLDHAVDWYQKVFGLEEIYDGTEQPHIRWLDLGNHQELHIIEVDHLQINIPKGVHLALTTADLDSFIVHLNALDIDFYDWPGKIAAKSVRPDGIEQVYIQDFDGYWIEINNGEKRHNH